MSAPATAADPTISTAGFTILSNSVLLDPSLSIESKATLGLLQFFDRGRGRGCFAKKETLCHYLNLSPYRLRKALEELAKFGFILINRRGQGQTDVIFVVYEEERETPESQPLPVEDFEDEMGIGDVDELEIDGIEEDLGLVEEGLDHVEEELNHVEDIEIEEDLVEVDEVREKVDRCEPGVKSADLELKEVEIQSSNESTSKVQLLEVNKDNYTHTTTEPGTIEPLDRTSTEKKCEEDQLILFFYQEKEGRPPTRNELINWKTTATRLLSEFTLAELHSATEYAIAKGARLFYYVALVGPSYILEQRQQKEIELQRAQIDSKAIEDQNEREHRFDTIKENSREYVRLTEDLLENLSMKLRPQNFNAWFRDAFITEITEDSLTLAVTSQGAVDWIRENYADLLQDISGKSDIKFIAG